VPGVLGFIFSLAGIFLPIPVLDVMISIAGLVLSIVGMIGNRRYRGLAIAGLVISIFSIIGGIVLIMFAPWFYHGIWYYG
jgi:Ni/Fe-hydrogenase subunit HybB-like protein